MKKWRLLLLAGGLIVLAMIPESGLPVGGGAVVTIPEQTPLIALTFDDGPREETTGILLEGLALREVPATFFLVGSRLESNEELVREMERGGHQIGIHTYDHVCMTELSRAEFDSQVERTRRELECILGEGEYWLRPPYGIVDETVAAWADEPLVLWSVDPEDWKDRDTERIVNAVISQVEDGDIILMHDIYSSSVEAALRIVDLLLERGYCFVTVEQLMELRKEEPVAGRMYNSFPVQCGSL